MTTKIDDENAEHNYDGDDEDKVGNEDEDVDEDEDVVEDGDEDMKMKI